VTQQFEVKVPDIGDFSDIPVIEVLVSTGEVVDAEQSLLTLESDKATMEIPAPVAGTITRMHVALGDTVSEGDIVVVMEADETVEPPQPVPQQAVEEQADEPRAEEIKPVPSPPAPVSTQPTPPPVGERQSPPVAIGAVAAQAGSLPYASPAIRRFARKLGVDLSKVTGSGRGGRIVREDVKAFVKSVMTGSAPTSSGLGFELPPPPKVNFSRYGEIELQPLSKIQKVSGSYLHRNWVSIPHVTQNDLADITDMEAYRKANAEKALEQGFKLTPLVFLIKASVAALKEFPFFNASLDESGENLVMKKFFHIGIAVDTPNGLVVPVIRDCDQKDIFELAAELSDLSHRAREGKLNPVEMQGGCFSISSLGGIGGTSFTPIINAPEVAILGVSRSSTQAVWDGESFQPRVMLPLCLSYDHRVVDGANGARFTRYVAGCLEDVENMDL